MKHRSEKILKMNRYLKKMLDFSYVPKIGVKKTIFHIEYERSLKIQDKNASIKDLLEDILKLGYVNSYKFKHKADVYFKEFEIDSIRFTRRIRTERIGNVTLYKLIIVLDTGEFIKLDSIESKDYFSKDEYIYVFLLDEDIAKKYIKENVHTKSKSRDEYVFSINGPHESIRDDHSQSVKNIQLSFADHFEISLHDITNGNSTVALEIECGSEANLQHKAAQISKDLENILEKQNISYKAEPR